MTQGQRHESGSCAYVGEGTIDPDGRDMQEIVVAEDPDTCRYLVVGGKPLA